MSLKGDRNIIETDVSNICNDVVSNKGLILCYGTAGSGNALGDNAGYVTLKNDPSGSVPAGLCLHTVVSIDQTVQHRNFHKDQQVVGEKVPLLVRGWVVTDTLVPGTTAPTIGGKAYVSVTGLLTAVSLGAAATPTVGLFKSIKDESGYVKVEISLPVL